jgi:CheY-like chemotaxis protein
MLLEAAHLEIDCAVNGIQAVDMFIEEPEKYELIFMDVHMPGMDGYEATRQIRAYEEKLSGAHKRVPIIAMTANVFKEDINNCINAGMDDHLGKPLNIDNIMDKLRNYIIKQE